MRVEKLDEEETEGLRALGFTIDADGEGAEIATDDLTISIVRPHRAEEFMVYIDLPNGSTLVSHASRHAIVRALKEDDE